MCVEYQIYKVRRDAAHKDQKLPPKYKNKADSLALSDAPSSPGQGVKLVFKIMNYSLKFYLLFIV